MSANRMHPGLVALSASAIAAIYLAGYVRTQAADASLGAAASASASPAAVAAAPPTPVPGPTLAPGLSRRGGRGGTQGGQPGQGAGAAPSSSSPTAPSPAPASTPQAQAQAPTSVGYKDGTYTGQGSSRRGDVWVSVQVQGGRITAVQITRSTLQYPVRDIAGLPDEVVQRQSAQVDTVSRATYSSQAFRAAVSQALVKAVGS